MKAMEENFSWSETSSPRSPSSEGESSPLTEKHMKIWSNFEKLDDCADVFQGHDVGYCCLGTTKGKAGTSLLLVDRLVSRPAEWLARKVFGGLSSVCPTSMAVPIEVVAKAMMSNTLLQPEQRMEILENKSIVAVGKSEGK